MNYQDPTLILRKGEPDELERLRAEVERLRTHLKLTEDENQRMHDSFNAAQQRAEAAEAALREMLRQFDYMDTMESEKKACEQARAALAAKGGAK